MKNIRMLLLLVLIAPFYVVAQSLVNSGASITIKDGSAIKINGKLIHHNNSHILNNGIISLNGDYENFSIDPVVFLPGTSGLLKFTGTNTHTIDGTGPLVVPNLTIETDVVFNNLVIIENHLHFNNGNIFLSYPLLDIETGATLSGYGPNSYIQTYGNEIITFPVKMSETTLPIGTTSNYTPISMVSNDGDGEVSVSLISDVLENGNSGATIPEIEQTIIHTWELNFWEFPSTPDLDIKFQWPGNVEGASFNPLTAALSYFSESAWEFFPVQGATGNDPYQLTQPGISESGFFTIWSKQPELITLDLKVFLEGPFNGTIMNSDLITAGLIPLNQPYSAAPWNYPGSESVTNLPNNQIVDWILIEGRDASNAASAIENTTFVQQAAFLLKDGSVVDLDGISNISFNTILFNQLFIVIKHRNHLPVMSGNPISAAGGIYPYDFTTSASQAYGNNQNNLGSAYGMIGGNGDASTAIDIDDKINIWMMEAGLKGYLFGDYTLDGQVDNRDKDDIWIHNKGQGSQVPN